MEYHAFGITMNPYDVELRDVGKNFNQLALLKDINLSVKRGEFFTILGPSGSGKTTILRIIMGFENPTSGEILVRDESVTNQPPHKRNIGMVFQSYALFPHLTIFENIAFSLKIRKNNKKKIIDRVTSMLELVGLQGYENRYPKNLSGGEQQRVALARALAFEPNILLLDEPLGALDRQLRDKMCNEIKIIQKRLRTTTIYVTHDQEEAFALSDRIAVIRRGVIQQVGTPEELYKYPKNLFIANFIGITNILKGIIIETGNDYSVIRTDLGLRFRVEKGEGFCLRKSVWVSIRPESIKLSNDTDNSFTGKIMDLFFKGSERAATVDIEGTLLKINVPGNLQNNIGDMVPISFASKDCITFMED
jgi:spermidine/putrescine ABC transporter ATP-binding subunit